MNKEEANIVWAIHQTISKQLVRESEHEVKDAVREIISRYEGELESLLSKLEDKVITGTMDNELIFRDKNSEEKRLEQEVELEAKRLTFERD